MTGWGKDLIPSEQWRGLFDEMPQKCREMVERFEREPDYVGIGRNDELGWFVGTNGGGLHLVWSEKGVGTRMNPINHTRLKDLLEMVSEIVETFSRQASVVRLRWTIPDTIFIKENPEDGPGSIVHFRCAIVTVFVSPGSIHRWESPRPPDGCSMERLHEDCLSEDEVKGLCNLYGFSVSDGEWTEDFINRLRVAS